MDALGINLQYLLAQCISFLFLILFSTLIAFALLLVIRSFRPEFLSKPLTTLEASSEGLLIPDEYAELSKSYELRKFGKAFVLIPQEG